MRLPRVLHLTCLVLAPLVCSAQDASPGACNARAPVEAIHAEDKRKLAALARMDPQKAADKFARKFTPLHATVTTDGTSFSAREMLDDLWDLYPLALAAGECSPELARLLDVAAIVEMKRGEPHAGMVFGEAALRIDDMTRGLPIDDAFYLHFQLADSAARGLNQPDKAVTHLQAALELESRVRSLDQLQRFGIRQELGYWLFEAGRYADARTVNVALLADAERVLGAEHEALLGILENLAQDSHKLGDPDQARSYLESCLALARKHRIIAVESRMLFQLGVLAHETGNDELARRYMRERVERVGREDGDRAMRAEALAAQDELEERILEGR